MLLTVDIGNSHITLGVFNGEELCFTARMATDTKRTQDLYAVDINGIMDLYKAQKEQITGSIICSVVPEITDSIARAIKKS